VRPLTAEIDTPLVGQTVEVIVANRHRDQWEGGTLTNKIVFFESRGDRSGRLVRVRVDWAGAWSQVGSRIDHGAAVFVAASPA
jgi:tRNA A37 methylthiotransferase MiaB